MKYGKNEVEGKIEWRCNVRKSDWMSFYRYANKQAIINTRD